MKNTQDSLKVMGALTDAQVGVTRTVCVVQCFGREISGLDWVGSARLDLAVLGCVSLKGEFAHL